MPENTKPLTPTGELTLRTLAMPADANPAGDIFGGWVLSQMDIAAGICAANEAKCRVATVGIEAMSFLKPVYIGDVLCIYSFVKKTGKTSIRISLEAWALRDRIGEKLKVTSGIFTFVALDENGKPKLL
jgi:acyl-CoA thioesterase YciA